MVIKDDAFFFYNMLMEIKMLLLSLLQHVDGDKDGDAVSSTIC